MRTLKGGIHALTEPRGGAVFKMDSRLFREYAMKIAKANGRIFAVYATVPAVVYGLLCLIHRSVPMVLAWIPIALLYGAFLALVGIVSVGLQFAWMHYASRRPYMKVQIQEGNARIGIGVRNTLVIVFIIASLLVLGAWSERIA